MGRFSKLETGAGAAPDKDPDEGPFGLRTRVRGKAAESSTASIDYDQGHYQSEGDRFFYAGDYQKAMRAYSRAMQVDHSAIDPWVGQVLSLVRLKQYREAAMWALRATELFPEDARLSSLQGLTLALTGARQRAIACSDFAMARPNGGTAFTWAVRGQILAHSENPNAAFCFEKVLETRDPGDWQIMALVGDFLISEKKWARAIEFLKPAVEANPGNAWLWKRLGYANEQLAFTQTAMAAYRSAQEINPNDREASESIRRLATTSLPTRLWRRLTRKK
jgi:superkiller protein 3